MGISESLIGVENNVVDKPWGWFEDLFRSKEFVIKRIYVLPYESLSLQSHEKRSEIWKVEKGFATVVLEFDGELYKDQYPPNYVLNIKCGQIHRLVNETDSLVQLLEIQQGEPECSEQDIKRISDKYERC